MVDPNNVLMKLAGSLLSPSPSLPFALTRLRNYYTVRNFITRRVVRIVAVDSEIRRVKASEGENDDEDDVDGK